MTDTARSGCATNDTRHAVFATPDPPRRRRSPDYDPRSVTKSQPTHAIDPEEVMHKSSVSRMNEFIEFLSTQTLPSPARVLDVGSFDVNGSYRNLFQGSQWRYEGLDVERGPGVDILVAQPYRWANVPSNAYDVVVSGQAFEHIEFPWVTILEVRRVLRPGGWCCLVVPSAGPEHRYPIDCWRFYPDGLTALARWADLDVERAHTWWEPEGWDDGSDEWRDSILVVRKPQQRGWWRLRSDLKRALLRAVMTLQAGRRTDLDRPSE